MSMAFLPPTDPEPLEAPQQREPEPAEFEPVRGDLVMATVNFPRGKARVECRVTHVKVRGERLVFGYYKTKRGAWSTSERTLGGPFWRIRSP